MGRKKDPSAAIKEARRAEDLAVAKALIVREAAIAAAQTFRHYAQIHRDKGDEAKAARNEDEAVKLTLAIMATANLPDFRALSNQFEEECRALRSRVAELEDSVRIEKSGRDAVVAGRDSSRRVTAKLRADLDTARAEVAALREEMARLATLLREAHETCPTYYMPSELDVRILEALDALRTRKANNVKGGE